MSNSINTARLNVSTGAKVPAEDAEVRLDQQPRTTPPPILDPKSVFITSQSDFEKILELFKDKYKRNQLENTKLTLFIALGEIMGKVIGLDEKQQAILDLLKQHMEALKKIIDNMTPTLEERKELERLRKNAADKRNSLKETLAALEEKRRSVEDGSEEAIALDKLISSTKTAISVLDGQIADYDRKITACNEKLAPLENQKAELEQKIDKTCASLSTTMRSLLFLAARLVIEQMPPLNDGTEDKKDKDEEKFSPEAILCKFLAKDFEKLNEEIQGKHIEHV